VLLKQRRYIWCRVVEDEFVYLENFFESSSTRSAFVYIHIYVIRIIIARLQHSYDRIRTRWYFWQYLSNLNQPVCYKLDIVPFEIWRTKFGVEFVGILLNVKCHWVTMNIRIALIAEQIGYLCVLIGNYAALYDCELADLVRPVSDHLLHRWDLARTNDHVTVGLFAWSVYKFTCSQASQLVRIFPAQFCAVRNTNQQLSVQVCFITLRSLHLFDLVTRWISRVWIVNAIYLWY
jgi:hypothetical protein